MTKHNTGPVAHGRRWRCDDDEFLLSCWQSGQEREVARELGRSVKACVERAKILGITRSRNWWQEERMGVGREAA